MRNAAWGLALLPLLGGCGGGTPATATTATTTPVPRVVVGGNWQATQLLADAGPRPADRCAAQGSSCARGWVQAIPVVAGNARGQRVAVFQRFVGGDYEMVAARYEPASGWGPPEPLLAEHGSLEPLVGLDEQGRALVVWWHDGVLVSTYGVPGRGWAAPQALVGGRLAKLAMAADGQAYLIIPRGSDGVDVMRFAPTGWSAPERLQGTRPDDAETYSVDVSVAPDGSALAVWLRVTAPEADPWYRQPTKSFHTEIWSSRLRAGAWSTPAETGAFDGGSQRLDVVASNTGGSIAFSTFGPQPFSWQVWGQHSDAGTWAAPLQLSLPLTPRAEGDPVATLAPAGGGNAVLAWAEGQPVDHHAHYLLRARTFSASSAAWTDTQLVFERTAVGGGRLGLQAAPGPAGNAVLAWAELSTVSEPARLLASHYVTGGGWSPPQVLATGGAPSEPQVAVDADGNAIVVWADLGERMQVLSARLTPVLAP